MKYDIIFEDEFLIAVNKPSGLLSIPDREGSEISLKKLLQEKFQNIFTVHRLDKGTSGVIVFAKNEETHKQLSLLFENRDTEKIYYGLVHGNVTNAHEMVELNMMQHPSGNNKMIISAKGKSSITEYWMIENFKQFSWLKFQIYTGKTHQIRLAAQHIQHSIVCDDIYGNPQPIYLSAIKHKYNLSKKEETEKPILARLALYAASLKFNLNNKEYFFEAPLPKDLKATLQQLRKLKAA